ncbi:MAG: hypothetical protein IAE91_09885 [Ignavibacteriaceae bacterium]|nr:hypothetical protein [Ignavibacteriaceae bacterium]
MDLVSQLEFLKTTLSNAELIHYANLPSDFSNIEIPENFLNEYNAACAKMRTLLTLLEEAICINLEEVIEQVVEIYQKAYPEDFPGLEIVNIDNLIILSVFNSEDLAFQIQLKEVNGVWTVEKYMTHFRLYGYNVEIRTSVNGMETIILHPPIFDLGVIPEVRDEAAIAAIRIPAPNSEDWFLRLVDKREDARNPKLLISDSLTIAPYRQRVINKKLEGDLVAQLVATEVDGFVQLQFIAKNILQLPDGSCQILSKFGCNARVEIADNADGLIETASKPDNIIERLTLVKRNGYSIPSSTKVEYFDNRQIRTLEVRFKPDKDIHSIVVNDKTYIYGEFSIILSPNGYYIIILGDTMQRIPVSFFGDYSIQVPSEAISPVYEMVDPSIDFPFTGISGINRTVSLN